MISTVVPLKKDVLVALDSGQVVHIAGACILVWDGGNVVRRGVQTHCARAIESTRLTRVFVGKRPCYRCARQYEVSPVPRQRVWADWFDLFGIRYQSAGIGVFVRR
jgi:hypothetical protein